MANRLAITLALSLSAVLAGCPAADPGPSDAAYADSFLFGECREDYQCPGEGAFCLKNTDGYPGGVCTKPCADRDDCQDEISWHWCNDDGTGSGRKICVARCLNGIDCVRDGYTCTPDIGQTGAGSCFPVCSDDAQCGEGTTCNRESGRCVTEPVDAKAENGAPCTADDQCRSGTCILEERNGEGTGWLGGSCSGPCILPSGWNGNTLYSGDELPNGTCPGEAVCYPDGTLAEGDPGTCYAACRADDDCRDGYACLLDFNIKTFDRGICIPMTCTDVDCPSGYLCQRTSRGYRCVQGT